MSVPMRRVVREWPATEAGRRAAELAYARGQLVHAERHGDVVRVVLQVPASTRPRQHPDRVGTRPRQGWRVPAAVIGVAVVAVGALVALLWWAVLWVCHWIGAHLPEIVGTVACVIGTVLAFWYLLGRAGACPGFHCPGCRHS